MKQQDEGLGWFRFLVLVAGLGVYLSTGVRTGAGDSKKSDAVVKVSATAEPLADDGNQIIRVKMVIDKDRAWHIYGNPMPKDFPGTPTTITVEGPVKPAETKVEYPEGQLIKDADLGDYRVYEEQVDIKVTVHRNPGDASPLVVSARFQACWQAKDQGLCLVPATVKVMVP